MIPGCQPGCQPAATVPRMNDTTIAWTRTTFTALWTGFVIWLAAKLGWTVDVEDPTVILVIGLTGGVVWRLSELLANVPYLGYILFGINKSPGYDQPTPPNPAEEAGAPDGFANNDVVWTIVGILAIVALILYILSRG